jgi:hypothetical protein
VPLAHRGGFGFGGGHEYYSDVVAAKNARRKISRRKTQMKKKNLPAKHAKHAKDRKRKLQPDSCFSVFRVFSGQTFFQALV